MFNPIETTDQPEISHNQFDTADLDARISQAEDVQPVRASDAAPTQEQLEQRVQQLEVETKAREAQELAELQARQSATAPPEIPAETTPKIEPPEGYIPASASGEKGAAERAETGPEKTEVKHYPGGTEGGW